MSVIGVKINYLQTKFHIIYFIQSYHDLFCLILVYFTFFHFILLL
jgi:hypothetical protein